MREEAAARTRRRIIDAAAACFTRSGYAATTMRAIATGAGVSVETVNGHGPKRELLFAAFDLAFSGREGPTTIEDRPDFDPTSAERGGREWLTGLVRVTVGSYERSYGLWRALTAASDVDEAVAEALAELLGRRRRELRGLVETLGDRGLPEPRDLEAAVDELSFLASHDAYGHFVVLGGWTRQRYEEWATEVVLTRLEALAAEG